jgi:16S rRNA (cytidine1402-2'-O)-methyltransferase
MGELYVIATPIGNLEDVTLRALRLLRECDWILAEDTRRTRVLLDRHGIGGRPASLHSHNEAQRTQQALERLAAGSRIALVSDAGTPLVSDPGARLVKAASEQGLAVVPVPGASAVLAALVACGLPVDRFAFLGFPPRKSGERRTLFESHAGRGEALVLFESPRRLAATLGELSEALGEREACVARELTKAHEQLHRGTLAALAEEFRDGARGEITLVVAGAAPGEGRMDADRLDARVREALAAGMSARDLASALSAEAGWPRRDVYARALSLKGQPAEGAPRDQEDERES